jgi:transaldolase
MKATTVLHDLGQSLWLDNITRDLLESGTLARYIGELSVTGLTSNPTIFDHAIKNSVAYDPAIRARRQAGKSDEAVFFELALEDLTRAADLLRPTYDRTDGVDGWVSLEVSPLLAYDTASTIAGAKDLHARAGRPNLLIKIPGTTKGLPATAPFTVNTMPEGTLNALAGYSELGPILPADGGDSEAVLDEGAKAFVKSWNDLMGVIASKRAPLEKASA